MFRGRDGQGSLFQTSMLLSEYKLGKMKKSWAWVFREKALPLIDEDAFADMYCQDNGRPNKCVQTVAGILILKDMWDLTDDDALGELEFDTRWHVALDLEPDDAHCCQKTLHNFRARLMRHEKGKVLFCQIADGVIDALGLSVARQRQDSSHIVSNIAMLTRLGLFCETIRVFLRALNKEHPEVYKTLSAPMRRRYIKEDGSDTHYDDARSSDARRRLAVCARDGWRMLEEFWDHVEISHMESYGLLDRLIQEQCGDDDDKAPRPKEDDACVFRR